MTWDSNRTNDQFSRYVNMSPLGLEVVQACLYSTQIYYSNETTRLQFFNDRPKHENWHNQFMPGMLPNPMAFLIKSIRVYGIGTDIALGTFRLTIGNKHYGDWPLWKLALREHHIQHNLFISPLQCFRAQIDWEKEMKLGRGIDGKWMKVRPIQVVLTGEMARASQ